MIAMSIDTNIDTFNKYLEKKTRPESSVLHKSRADFEPQGSFRQGLGTYSLESGRILQNYRQHSKTGWFRGKLGGNGGIPLSYESSEKTVYFDNTDTHSLIIGATGSKKTRLIALPSVRILAEAGESMIISDPKAEIYNATAAELHARGYIVAAFNLRNPSLGVGWNPLAIPYQFYCCGDIDRACEFANDVAINLTSVDTNEKDPFWNHSAGSFFFGLTILLFKYCHEHTIDIADVNLRNILELRNQMCTGTDSSIRSTPLWQYAKRDSFLRSLLIGTIETASVTRQGILSVFDQNMRLFSIQPYLLDVLSINEFDFDGIAEKPTAIFLITPDEKTSYHGLVSLFVKQSYEYIIYKSQKNIDNCPFLRINYILDEFSSLPAIKDFPAMITAARSRNIRFALFIQSKNQLTQKYDREAQTIMANCSNWIFLTSRELDLLEELSKLCGNKEGSTTQKPILSISELQRFNKENGEVLVLSDRYKPYMAYLPDIDKYPQTEPLSLIHKPRIYMRQKELNFVLRAQEYIDPELLKKAKSAHPIILPRHDIKNPDSSQRPDPIFTDCPSEPMPTDPSTHE